MFSCASPSPQHAKLATHRQHSPAARSKGLWGPWVSCGKLQARRKAEALGLRNTRFEVGDVDDLELPAGGFDASLCSNGMIYFADTAGALRRISAWLRPGGRLVFNTPLVRSPRTPKTPDRTSNAPHQRLAAAGRTPGVQYAPGALPQKIPKSQTLAAMRRIGAWLRPGGRLV